MGERCTRCGKVIDDGAPVVVTPAETIRLDLDRTATNPATTAHVTCAWDPPQPFDSDLPTKPGRGWLVTTCRGHGLDTTGSNADLVQRLVDVGFPPMDPPLDL